MDRAELIERASPPCHECGDPVRYVEMAYKGGPLAGWVLRMTMVCARGHRVPVEPITEER